MMHPASAGMAATAGGRGAIGVHRPPRRSAAAGQEVGGALRVGGGLKIARFAQDRQHWIGRVLLARLQRELKACAQEGSTYSATALRLRSLRRNVCGRVAMADGESSARFRAQGLSNGTPRRGKPRTAASG